MNLKRAIEIKGRTGEEFLNTDPDEIEEADRLSIEALKREQKRRSLEHPSMRILLPGETKKYCKFCGLVHHGMECPNRGSEK